MTDACARHSHGARVPTSIFSDGIGLVILAGRVPPAYPSARGHRADQDLPRRAVAAHRPRVPLPADLLRVHRGSDRPLRALEPGSGSASLASSAAGRSVPPGLTRCRRRCRSMRIGTRRGDTGGGRAGTSTRRRGSTCRSRSFRSRRFLQTREDIRKEQAVARIAELGVDQAADQRRQPPAHRQVPEAEAKRRARPRRDRSPHSRRAPERIKARRDVDAHRLMGDELDHLLLGALDMTGAGAVERKERRGDAPRARRPTTCGQPFPSGRGAGRCGRRGGPAPR